VTSSLSEFEAAIWVVTSHASEKIMFETQKKKIKYGNKRNVYIKIPSKRLFRNRIHSLLRRADARGSADIIYRI